MFTNGEIKVFGEFEYDESKSLDFVSEDALYTKEASFWCVADDIRNVDNCDGTGWYEMNGCTSAMTTGTSGEAKAWKRGRR